VIFDFLLLLILEGWKQEMFFARGRADILKPEQSQFSFVNAFGFFPYFLCICNLKQTIYSHMGCFPLSGITAGGHHETFDWSCKCDPAV